VIVQLASDLSSVQLVLSPTSGTTDKDALLHYYYYFAGETIAYVLDQRHKKGAGKGKAEADGFTDSFTIALGRFHFIPLR